MKQRIKHFSKSTMSVILAVCMLVSCLTVGWIATDAAQVAEDESVGDSKVSFAYAYFAVPDSWTMTGKNVYLAYTKTDGPNYTRFLQMTRLGETNLYAFDGSTYTDNKDHYSLGFVASASTPSGSNLDDLSSFTYYTSRINYEIKGGSQAYYGFKLTDGGSSATGNIGIAGQFGDNNAQTAGHIAVTINTTTDGNEDCSGGYVQVSGKRLKTKNTLENYSDSTENEASHASWGAMGTPVTLTAQPKDGYAFNGYYDASNDTLVSSSETYTYNLYERTVYARFVTDNTPKYYVTSAGQNDSTKGFTDNIWAPKDADGKMTDNNDGTYSITFNNQAMGWYRFKVNGFNGNTSLGSWGGAKVTYTNDTDTNACIVDRSTENSGNAKFRLTKKSDVTVTFDADTHAITVTAEAVGGDPAYEYYVVGMAFDGTVGMFGNVWADDWKEFSSADKMTESSTGVWTKTYTDFGGTYGTYSYKIAKVDTVNGTYETFDNTGGTGANLTQDINDGATSAVFKYDSTQATASQVSCTVSYVSDWTPSDPNTSGFTTNGSRYIFYGTDASFNSGRGLTAQLKKNDSSHYWCDLSSVIIEGRKSSLYLYLTKKSSVSDCSYQDHYNTDAVQGDSSNTAYLAGGTETEAKVNGTTYFKLGVQNNNDISGSKKYVKITSIDYSKLEKIGVEMYYSGSSVKYYFYYKYKGSSGGGEDTSSYQYVNVYAKNGCLRDNTYNRFTHLVNTDVISITTPAGITYDATKWNAVSGNTWENDKSGYGSHYAYVTNVPVGSVLKLRATLGSTYDSTYGFDNKPFKDTHYLKAYSFNGKTYELHQWNESGVYEEDWVVEQVNTANMKKEGDNDRPVVEITPIYYLKDNTYTKTFYIDGYEGLLSEKWGNMLAVYPYYSGSSDKKNAFGGYPGQPMLYWGGKYQMEIPITVDGTANGKEVKGLTMHNAYWDLLHRKLDKSCDDGHCQTYDYDDFYKIYKEKNADTIFFRYKYFPKKDYTYNGSTISAGKDNYGDKYEYENRTFAGNSAKSAANFTGSNGNGVEVVTDFYGRQIDAFGTILTDSQKSDYDMTGSQTKELLFVSSGYKNTYVGHYATIWAVYAPQEGMKGGDSAGKLIGYISSSMLYLNNIGRVSQYSGGTNTASGKMSWSVFKNTYNHLKQYYEGVPALISYEKEIHNDSLDQADRSDGKWYYSTTGDRLTANIKIQYTSATGTYPAIDAVGSNLAAQWVEDPFDGTKTGAGSEHNIGTSTGCSAYFTNTTPEYLYGKVRAEDIIADNESQFSFMATAASGYKFVGWVRYSDGKYYEITSKDGLGQSNMSANDTYIARFVPQAKGSLVVSHNIMKDATHTGDGTKYLKVEVLKSDNTVVKTYEKTDGTDIDVSKYIGSDYSTYKLRITLATEPDEDCAVAERTVDLGADEKYDRYRTNSDNTAINYGLPVSSSYTSTLLLNISDIYDNTNGVTALRYTTMLTKTPVNYAYEIVYHYTSRFWGDQSYTVRGTIDELQSAKYFSGVKTTATLLESFIKSSTPYEKNFRQKITWNYDGMTNNPAGEPVEDVYTMRAVVHSANTVDDTVRGEFFLPYKYNDTDKNSTGLNVFASAEATTPVEGASEIAFDDESNESFTIKTQAGHLFNYDNSIPPIPTPEQTTENFPKLLKAAPYVLKKGVWNSSSSQWEYTNVDFHYTDTYSTKEYADQFFELDGTYYYCSDTIPTDIPNGVTTEKLTASDTVAWYDDNKASTTYTYAKQSGNTVYYFTFDGSTCTGYCISDKGREIDGIIQRDIRDILDTEPSDTSQVFYKKFYFTKWDIYTADGKNYVASSYTHGRAFNYSGYEDYVIIPVYENRASNSSVFTTITYLGDTRNQWNEGGLGHYKTGAEGNEESTNLDDCNEKGDKILIDFALAYNNAGTKLTNSDKAGFIIERLDKVEKTDGTAVTNLGDAKAITDPAYYEKKYAAGSSNAYAYNSAAVLSSADGFATSSTTTRPTCCGAAIFRAATISKLDNFDRMQYTNTFTNVRDNTPENGNTGQALYVYRATSYMKISGQNTVISEQPIYFTLYDIASR